MRKHAIISLLIVLTLAACNSQQTPPALPTLFPSATPVGAKPPPNTPKPTATKLTNTPAPLVRPTLPPEYTSTPTPIDTAVPPTDTPAPTIVIATLVPACDTFGPDPGRSVRNFQIGTTVTVAWTKVEGAGSYHLVLVNEFAEQLLEEYIAETTYTFRADLFKAGVRYGWEVYPLDARGIQMCYSRGDELIPFAR